MKKPSKLLLSGGWFNKKGIFICSTGKVTFPVDIEGIKADKKPVFLIISYQETCNTLHVPIKKEIYPSIITVEIEDIKPYELSDSNTTIEFISIKDRKEDYIRKVKEIKKEIEKGTIYQVNLTTRIDFSFRGEREGIFSLLFKRQPVPFGFFLDLGDFFVVSGSMELFIEKVGKHIKSSPIKGTASNRYFLQKSLKDKAENLMITDMVRNDLGRIAIPGSVRVTELFKIKKYRTLYQMFSTVEAETEEGFTEIIKNTFPPASVTGAPKKKAVELIDKFEDHPRGYYCGCGGILYPDGNFTLSVLIRTGIGKEKVFHYYAGCGIVWDSDPESEFKELLLKTKALYDFPFNP